ncbi:MAG: MucBP domain-containing protein [Oscillospiraceae bacterium]|nr:MucBP domain-containing protein [Oscillospiraceae bacterium]
MKRKFQRTAICCILVCLCMVLSLVPAFAADATYVLSFRPGVNGSFSSGAESYLSGFGEVQKTAAGNLFVKVEDGTAFPSNIVSYLQTEDGYYYKGGLSGSTVNGDADYVAEYGVLNGSGVLYTVQYVDATTGAALAESYQSYANAGDTITFSSKTVQGYAADSASKSVTVSDGAVLSFLYSSDGSNDQTTYVYGENTVITQTVATQPAETQAETAQETTPAGNETQPATTAAEEIPEESVPLNEGQTTASATEEEITSETVPQSSGTEHAGLNAGMIAGISGAVILLLAAALILLRKKPAAK